MVCFKGFKIFISFVEVKKVMCSLCQDRNRSIGIIRILNFKNMIKLE